MVCLTRFWGGLEISFAPASGEAQAQTALGHEEKVEHAKRMRMMRWGLQTTPKTLPNHSETIKPNIPQLSLNHTKTNLKSYQNHLKTMRKPS